MTFFRGSFVQGAALWRAGDFGQPSPTLTWQQHRRMPPDPATAADAAQKELRERGVLTANGPKDEYRDLLEVFAHADVEADLKYVPAAGREVRVLVALRGQAAARWWITPDDVEIETIRATSAWHAFVATLPHVPPVPGKPVTLRSADLDTAATALRENAEDVERTAIDTLRQAGVRSDDARRAIRMLRGGRTLKGQFGAAAYTSGPRQRVRGGRIIEVLDKLDGRVIRYQVGAHTTIAPGDPAVIAAALGQLVEEVRADADSAQQPDRTTNTE